MLYVLTAYTDPVSSKMVNKFLGKIYSAYSFCHANILELVLILMKLRNHEFNTQQNAYLHHPPDSAPEKNNCCVKVLF